MKKNTLILSILILSLICFGFLGFNTAGAYDSGCIGSNLYSITTGQLCSIQYGYSNYNNYSNNYNYGCTSGGLYNIFTGQLCSNQYGYSNNYGYNYNNNYSNNYSYGCTSGEIYNIYTGQLCSGSQYASSNNFLNQQFQIGARGPEIVALQQMLNDAGFFVGNIDGIYGLKTDRAFLDYLSQYSNNYSNNYSYGCTSAGPFNIITGQLCNTSQYSNSYQNIYPYYNQAPVISGVNGPQSLSVNQMGTWTVLVSNINNSGNLSYSINWGDQPLYAYGVNNSSVYLPQQSATFTHTYTQAGTYRPVFTVTNSSGQSATTSLSVVVGGSSTTYGTPVLYSIYPISGRVGTQVTISGTGFGNNNNCYTTTSGTTISTYCGNGVMANTINFGGSIIQNVSSYNNGTNLTFTVPSNLNTCYTGQYCSAVYSPVVPGIYPVSVTNTNGVSNVIYFTVTY